jgi:uncharacterized protein YycO
MWNVKTKVIAVIIGANGTISKSLRQYLSNITEKHEIKEIQKNNHIGHWTHTAESTNLKVQNSFHGRNNKYSPYTGKKALRGMRNNSSFI